MSPTIYQPEENDNFTLHWDTKTRTDLSQASLDLFLQSKTLRVLYRMINGVEVPDSQHQQFAGRVQLERDALRVGQIRLHLSTVTAEDSGNYWCELAANYDTNKRRWGLTASEQFVLNVIQKSRGDIRDILSATGGRRHLGGSQQGDICTIVTVLISVGGAAALLGVLVSKILPCSKITDHDEIRQVLIKLLLNINIHSELDVNELV
ncbi:uncharacterized protein [Channa argus]